MKLYLIPILLITTISNISSIWAQSPTEITGDLTLSAPDPAITYYKVKYGGSIRLIDEFHFVATAGSSFTIESEKVLPALSPIVETTNFYTIKNGDWTDHTVWNTGLVPSRNSAVTISDNHTITLDQKMGMAKSVFIHKTGKLIVSNQGILQVEDHLDMEPTTSSSEKDNQVLVLQTKGVVEVNDLPYPRDAIMRYNPSELSNYSFKKYLIMDGGRLELKAGFKVDKNKGQSLF